MSSPRVGFHDSPVLPFKLIPVVPLATLLTSGLPPSSTKSPGSQPAILSSEGKKRYLVVHGGPPVSKDGVTLEDISKVERFGRQPGQEGIMCEMLWTDPQEQPGRAPSKRVSFTISVYLAIFAVVDM